MSVMLIETDSMNSAAYDQAWLLQKGVAQPMHKNPANTSVQRQTVLLAEIEGCNAGKTADQPVSSYSTAALSRRLPTYAHPKYIRTTAAATTAKAPRVPLIIHSAGCSAPTDMFQHTVSFSVVEDVSTMLIQLSSLTAETQGWSRRSVTVF